MADSPSPKGPHSTEHSSGHDLGFDPVGPAKAPKDVKPGEDDKKPAKPYDPLANLKP